MNIFNKNHEEIHGVSVSWRGKEVQYPFLLDPRFLVLSFRSLFGNFYN